MSESASKCRKIYEDSLKYRLPLTCIIHGPENSSYECKFLCGFGSKYTKYRPTKDCKKYPSIKKKFVIQQENNAMVQHEVDEINLQTWSIPKFHLWSHSLVCIENHLFGLGIGTILNKDL